MGYPYPYFCLCAFLVPYKLDLLEVCVLVLEGLGLHCGN